MFGIGRAVSLVNGRVLTPDGIAASIRFRSRVLALHEAPRQGDAVIDLNGAFVLPGLINAHDHLELNHYGPLKARERYQHASEWIDDMRSALHGDPGIRRNRSFPLRDRLFIGGLKNLLAGVTTVAHHNPMYREIIGHVPVRVVKEFGWAHSFGLEREPVGAHGEPGGNVRERCHRTPSRAPFIVHAAEGVNAAAAAEVARLCELGCVKQNTVLVHGVAVSELAWRSIMDAGASLVWCPSSNRFLFGCTAAVRAFLDAAPHAWGHICLGSDSRITGSRDLLDEIRHAAAAVPTTPTELLRMVTTVPAGVLRLPHGGRLVVNAPADLFVLPGTGGDAADALVASRREDVALVAIGGRPMLAIPQFAALFPARRRAQTGIRVDGRGRLADAEFARRMRNCAIREPGIECPPAERGA
jgi:hypothetical protein